MPVSWSPIIAMMPPAGIFGKLGSLFDFATATGCLAISCPIPHHLVIGLNCANSPCLASSAFIFRAALFDSVYGKTKYHNGRINLKNGTSLKNIPVRNRSSAQVRYTWLGAGLVTEDPSKFGKSHDPSGHPRHPGSHGLVMFFVAIMQMGLAPQLPRP